MSDLSVSPSQKRSAQAMLAALAPALGVAAAWLVVLGWFALAMWLVAR